MFEYARGSACSVPHHSLVSLILLSLSACVSDAPQQPDLFGYTLAGEQDAGTNSDDSAAEESQEGELPPEVPRPDFMRNRSYLPDRLLRKKREGEYVTGFPVVGFDNIEGVVVGARVQWYNNGSKDDPFFRSTAYRSSISAVLNYTTEDVRRAFGVFDFPYAFGSPQRVRLIALYEDIPVMRYFGVGEETLGPLTFPGAPGQTFSTYDSYKSALQQERNGLTYAKYDEWRNTTVDFGVTVERDVAGGIVRPLVGLSFRYVGVEDFTGQTVDARDPSGAKVGATQQSTHLRDDHLAGKISGFDGGWDCFLKLGITVDTRDFEPNPSRGILGQITAELSTRFLGSSFDYQRVTTSLGGYYSPFSETALTLVARGLYSMQFGDVPFFSLNRLAFNTNDVIGLGSFQTLRGFQQNRFIGDSVALLNAEARWFLVDFNVWSEYMQLGPVGFVETGRVFDGLGFSLDDWKLSYGGGVMLGWNLSTIIRFDVAFSSEGDIFYVEVGHPF